jgi:hypothetical protein
MKFAKIAPFILLLPLSCMLLPSTCRGQNWAKTTTVTFSQIVEIPGRLLPAGTYVFKLAHFFRYRHIVQICNEDETTVLATVFAIPTYRLKPTGDAFVALYEDHGIGPQAVRAWFYPGDNFGQEFVYYPTTLANLLADLSNAVLPAEKVDADKGDLKSTPPVTVTPDAKEENITEATQTDPNR